MSHYHVERKHDDNEAFGDFGEAVMFIVTELNQGLTVTASRSEWSKSKSIVEMMHHYMELSSWEVNAYDAEEGLAYRELGDRSWNIVECNSYKCTMNGSSW